MYGIVHQEELKFFGGISDKYQNLVLAGTVKSVLSGHSKIGKTKVLKIDGSLMQVKSIAECSLGAFCNTFDLH